MVRKLDYSLNGKPYMFNLSTFGSQEIPQGQPNGLSLVEAINKYFEFTAETKYNENCYFSQRFETFILPLENQLGNKNFVAIKNDKIYNPNQFVGFALGKEFLKRPYLINDLSYAGDNQNWIYFSQLNKGLIDFVINKYGLNPQFENNFKGQVLHLLSCIPSSWKYMNDSTLRIFEPSVEDRTVLINLLSDEEFIEFDKQIAIFLNPNNISFLAKHCLTLYSSIQ